MHDRTLRCNDLFRRTAPMKRNDEDDRISAVISREGVDQRALSAIIRELRNWPVREMNDCQLVLWTTACAMMTPFAKPGKVRNRWRNRRALANAERTRRWQNN